MLHDIWVISSGWVMRSPPISGSWEVCVQIAVSGDLVNWEDVTFGSELQEPMDGCKEQPFCNFPK